MSANYFDMVNRKTIRFKNWDYTHPGAYFITICTKKKECSFGEIINKKLQLSKIGRIAEEYLIDIPNHFPHVILEQYVVMPNHIHLILYQKKIKKTCHVQSTSQFNDGNDKPFQCVTSVRLPEPFSGTSHGMSLPMAMTDNVGLCHGIALHDYMKNDASAQYSVTKQPTQNEFGKPIKGSVSVIINQFKSSVKRWCNKNNHSYFEWQTRFYDQFIRDDQSYVQISNYIQSNPYKWNEDIFYSEYD